MDKSVINFRDLLHSENWPESTLNYAVLIFTLVLTLSVYSVQKRQRYADAPIVGIVNGKSIAHARQRFRTDAQSMLLEGYEKHKGKPFYVPSPLGERLMIPSQYVEELKTAPIDEVDFVGTFFEMFEGKYTTMGSRSTLHPRVAKGPLNRHMETVLDPLYDEIASAFEEYVPSTEEWSEVLMADKFLQIVARASSRMFGGLDLSRNAEWLNATLNFATDGFIGAQKIKQYPHLIRPIVAPFIKELKNIHHHYEVTRKAVVPILEAREAMADKPSDFLQWMVDDAHDAELDKNFISSIQLKITFAALHTSAAAPMQLLYDLCSMPEYIAPLRVEIQQVLNEYGKPNKQALMKMAKLDSFMKESQRFNPLLLTTFERIVHKEYRLSDGFIIPAGTTIGVPSQAISMDPELYPHPTKFDGYRFSNIRANASNPAEAGKVQWAASNLDNMAFGYGRHACPGRFFAGHEIKQIMIYLLMNYDFKYQDETTARPENLKVETQLIPNHSAKILMRTRRV